MSKSTHDHQWVTERIALGSAVTRFSHVRCLAAENVTHVLDCRVTNPHPELYAHSGIVHQQCGAIDDGVAKVDGWFHGGVRFALEALAKPNTRLLIHCLLGVSRGPAMTFAVLRLLGFTQQDAEVRIKAAREIVRRIAYQEDAERAIAALLGPQEPESLQPNWDIHPKRDV